MQSPKDLKLHSWKLTFRGLAVAELERIITFVDLDGLRCLGPSSTKTTKDAHQLCTALARPA